MPHRGRGGQLKALLHEELRLLLTVNRSDRMWQMPFAAALAMGLPLLIGAYFDHLNYGLVSSLDFAGKVLLRNHTQLGNPVRFGVTSLNTNNGQQICGRDDASMRPRLIAVDDSMGLASAAQGWSALQ